MLRNEPFSRHAPLLITFVYYYRRSTHKDFWRKLLTLILNSSSLRCLYASCVRLNGRRFLKTGNSVKLEQSEASEWGNRLRVGMDCIPLAAQSQEDADRPWPVNSLSSAVRRRSRWGSVRGWPVLSSHLSPGFAPQVGQRTSKACLFFAFITASCGVGTLDAGQL